jgi:succinylglutamate desuccinylase
MENHESIFLREGKEPGKTVAVFCGVHGNEKAGIRAVKTALKTLEIRAGKVYFVFGNPKAIENNVRYKEKNLNRCFEPGNRGTAYEDGRARELMKILDECELLLDLHASNNPESTPFVICEANGMKLAEKLDFGIISTGWTALEPGSTDYYMNLRGKVGICLECGSVHHDKQGEELAYTSIQQFLTYTQNIQSDIPFTERERRHIELLRVIKKRTANFTFSKTYHDFERLEEGSLIARDGNMTYMAGKDECIIFPNPNKQIGEEVFLIGRLEK